MHQYFCMKVYFELDPKEKKQEWLLLSLFILFAFTVGKGVYNQTHHIDQDNILIPLFFFIGGSFFLLYGLNGLRKGNLIQKWTPAYLFNFLVFILNRIFSLPKEKGKSLVARILGMAGIIVAVVCYLTAIVEITKNK
jgi:peptidoglycan/LPS O-acetylase OafA/YrhL